MSGELTWPGLVTTNSDYTVISSPSSVPTTPIMNLVAFLIRIYTIIIARVYLILVFIINNKFLSKKHHPTGRKNTLHYQDCNSNSAVPTTVSGVRRPVQ